MQSLSEQIKSDVVVKVLKHFGIKFHKHKFDRPFLKNVDLPDDNVKLNGLVFKIFKRLSEKHATTLKAVRWQPVENNIGAILLNYKSDVEVMYMFNGKNKTIHRYSVTGTETVNYEKFMESGY